MGLYVRLISLQVEAFGRPRQAEAIGIRSQSSQGLQETRHSLQIRCRHGGWLRPAAGQHLADPFTQFCLVSAVLRHLLAEVLGIEDQALEQEPRRDIGPAVLALVPSDPKGKLPATFRAALEGDRRINDDATGLTPALSLCSHGQRIAAVRAGMAREHHLVVEPASPISKPGHGVGQAEGLGDDVSAVRQTAHCAMPAPPRIRLLLALPCRQLPAYP